MLFRVKNWNNLFEEGYYLSSLSLDVCDFENLQPLRSLNHYTGIHCLLFEKALSSWHWGKSKECFKQFKDLVTNYWYDLSEYQKNTTKKYLKDHYDTNADDFLKTSKIPVIGVTIVNGVHWLKRLIDSVDYPVEEFFIINNNGRGELTEELDALTKIGHKFIDKITVTHLPSNLGCSGSWNLIIKSYMNSPFWIITSNDIQFSPGLLESMYNQAKNTHYGMIHAKPSSWGGGSYDLFLLKDWVVQKCGLFDENLYPAYEEDVDYYIRIKNEGIPVSYLDIDYLHGDVDYETTGSQTWRIEPDLKEKIDHSRISNETQYLHYKWGPEYKSLNTYKKPFDNQNLDNTYTKYDLNFLRSKNLGF